MSAGSRFFYPLLLAGAVLFQSGARTGREGAVLSLLLTEDRGRRAAILDYRPGERGPRTELVSLSPFDGLNGDPGIVPAGGMGRGWLVGSLCTRLLVLGAATGRSRYVRLPQYETEADGYFPYRALPLSRSELFVRHNHGA